MSRSILIVFGSVAAVLLSGCNAPLGKDSEVTTLLKAADRSVFEMRYRKTGSGKTFSKRLEYGKPETQQIVGALLGAKRDRGVYDTAKFYVVKIYSEAKCIAEIRTGSGLFVFRGKQYRDESGTLSKLVDGPLDSAREMEEKSPEPSTESQGLRPAP
jgi:hypothetical protein